MRHNRNNHKDIKEKEYMALYREYMSLHDAKKTSGTYVPVEPYQRGWVRTLVIKEHVKTRRDIQIIKQILDMTNVTQFSRRKDFKVKSWKTNKYEERKHLPKSLLKHEYENLNSRMKKYFTKRIEFSKLPNGVLFDSRYLNQYIEYYDFIHPNYFESKVEPNIIDTHWVPDEELETRLAEVSHQIDRLNLWPKIYHSMGYRYSYNHFDRKHYKYDQDVDLTFEKDDIYLDDD